MVVEINCFLIQPDFWPRLLNIKPASYIILQALKYLKIDTCPASQNVLADMGKISFSVEISKYSLALQHETLVNTSRRVLFSSPVLLWAVK